MLYAPRSGRRLRFARDRRRAQLAAGVAVANLDGEVVARADVRNRGAQLGRDGRAGGAPPRHPESSRTPEVAPAAVVHAVVGTPGVYDEQRRQVRYAMHLPGWGRAGLFDRMREDLGVPLEVHNDANLAALGEYTYGVGAGRRRLFAYIMIGTGLGMGVVSEGRLFTGAHGGAGEIGFLPWPRQQKPETLEDAVSGVAVVEAARMFGMSGQQLTAKAVFDAARQGNPAAVKAS
ncbi:ROK family protein [Streptomyces sp. L7]